MTRVDDLSRELSFQPGKIFKFISTVLRILFNGLAMEATAILKQCILDILNKISNGKSSLLLFVNFTFEVFHTFEYQSKTEKAEKTLPASIELKKLNRLVRYLTKSPIKIPLVQSIIADFHPATRHFLTLNLKTNLKSGDIESFEYYVQTDFELALSSVKETRLYFHEPKGHNYSTADLNLARSLVRIYETVSGKKFGVGSSSSGPDKLYMTPGETFLFNMLKLMTTRKMIKHPTTIEGVRGLYRAACRSTPSAFRNQ